MDIARRLYGTITVLRYALRPASTDVEPYCHCADFNRAVDETGHLELFFPDCFFPAAVFLLFRLKRQGFSGCRATVSHGGVLLIADR